MSPATSAPPGMARRVLRLLRPYRGRVALLALVITVGAALGVAAPLLSKAVFDRALFPPGGEPDMQLLVVLVLAMAALVALSGAAGIVQTYLTSTVGQLVMHDLRDQLYRHLQRMALRFFTGTRTGEIQSRIANDVNGVGSIVSRSVVSAAANVVFMVFSLVAMLFLSWQLALLTLPVLPIFVFVSYRAGQAKRRVAKQTQETLAEMSSITQETLSVSGALLAKVFDRQREAIDRYQAESRRLVELNVRQQMIGRVVLGLAQTFFLLTPAIVYLSAGIAATRGSTSFTPGTLVAFTALQLRLFGPLRELLDTSMTIQASGALFERVFQYLDLPLEIVDGPRARALTTDRVRGAVAFRGVWFRYSSPAEGAATSATRRDWTLEDVDLRVEPGQLAALVGPSGAGKTTMSYLVARLYDVDRGAVEIDGIDVRSIKLSSLADVIGMVTQETYLFNASVRDNLLYARPDATHEEIEAAARLAFIHDRIAELDDGYDTIVGERGYRMSGGEKQRLAIARVILKDPRILILDEATSALDTASERLVQSALQPLLANRTTIAIAHRLSTVLAADVIFVLDRGRVVERGTHASLVEHGGLYARLYAQQFALDPVALGDPEAVAAPAPAV